VSEPFRQALLAAWFAQHRDALSELELAAAAAAQIGATPTEVARLVAAWRDRHQQIGPDCDRSRPTNHEGGTR
jgi:hypothetical protein